MVTSIISAKLMRPGLAGIFGYDFKTWQDGKEYSEIFDETKSDKRFEEYQELYGMGIIPEQTAGANVTYDDFGAGSLNQVVNVAYGMGYIITREFIDDNLYKLAAKFPKSLAKSVKITTEYNGANILNRGFSSSYLYGDGKALFATDHVVPGTNGTFQNKPTTDADLSEAALEQAFIDIGGLVDPRGLQAQIMPKKLIVHRNDMCTATKLIESAYTPGDANNSVNPVQWNHMLPDGFRVNHYLTDSNAWFIKTDNEGAIFQNRVWPAEFRDDNDFESLNIKQATYFRYRFWVYDPRSLYGSQGGS